jgi:hypothetical protein
VNGTGSSSSAVLPLSENDIDVLSDGKPVAGSMRVLTSESEGCGTRRRTNASSWKEKILAYLGVRAVTV